MRHLVGLVLAGGLVLGVASVSRAQFSLSIGNPYAGQGIAIGNTGFGYPGYGINSYGPGYPAYGAVLPGYTSGYVNSYTTVYGAGPGNFAYSSGYRGFAPPVRPYGYGYGPNFGYRRGIAPYYGGYGYGPYRNFGRFYR